MAQKTSISWTDVSWNPVTGCSHVSPGCNNCYAETLSLRFGRSKHPWGAQWAAENVVLHPERLDQPLRWNKPQKVFVNSMSDLFHERIPNEFIRQVFGIMAMAADRHVFQILTKRPERMLEWFAWMDQQEPTRPTIFTSIKVLDRDPKPSIAAMQSVEAQKAARYPGQKPVWPLPNVWLGVSVEDQRRADERIPLLLQTPAAVHFLSCEPLLGPLEIKTWLDAIYTGYYHFDFPQVHVDWVICGGESGPKFRPMNPDWARSLRDQCQSTKTAFWFKQGSGIRPQMNELLDGQEWHQFPTVGAP